MAYPTDQDLQDAKTDIDNLEAFTNDTGTVTLRSPATTIKTMRELVTEFEGEVSNAQAWAVETDAPVITSPSSEYSSKEYAQGAQSGTGGSAKNWAQETGGDVTGASANSKSAKAWAQSDLTGATLGGSSKDWAQTTGGTVDGSGYSSKAYAQDNLTGAAGGSAKDWAQTAEDIEVAGGGFSAKHFAAKAQASLEAFEAIYLGAQSSDPSVDGNGDPVTAGDWYYNTTSGTVRIYTGSLWVDAIDGVTEGSSPTFDQVTASVFDASTRVDAPLFSLTPSSGAPWSLDAESVTDRAEFSTGGTAHFWIDTGGRAYAQTDASSDEGLTRYGQVMHDLLIPDLFTGPLSFERAAWWTDAFSSAPSAARDYTDNPDISEITVNGRVAAQFDPDNSSDNIYPKARYPYVSGEVYTARILAQASVDSTSTGNKIYVLSTGYAAYDGSALTPTSNALVTSDIAIAQGVQEYFVDFAAPPATSVFWRPGLRVDTDDGTVEILEFKWFPKSILQSVVEKDNDIILLSDYVTGAGDETAGVQSAIDAAVAGGGKLDNNIDVQCDSNLTNFYAVKWVGTGSITRGSNEFYPAPAFLIDQVGKSNTIYVNATSGSDSNDGLGASQAFATTQGAINALRGFGALRIATTIQYAGETLTENWTIPNNWELHAKLTFAGADVSGGDPTTIMETNNITSGDFIDIDGIDNVTFDSILFQVEASGNRTTNTINGVNLKNCKVAVFDNCRWFAFRQGIVAQDDTVISLKGGCEIDGNNIDDQDCFGIHALFGTQINVSYETARTGTIIGATQANPVVLTFDGLLNGSDPIFSNGDVITVHNVPGMTDLNQNRYKVANINTGNATLELTDLSDGNINGTGFSAYTSTSASITGATAADPVVITATAHGYDDGQLIYISGVGGMTELNGSIYQVANSETNTFELRSPFGDFIDGSAYTAYTSGGTADRAGGFATTGTVIKGCRVGIHSHESCTGHTDDTFIYGGTQSGTIGLRSRRSSSHNVGNPVGVSRNTHVYGCTEGIVTNLYGSVENIEKTDFGIGTPDACTTRIFFGDTTPYTRDVKLIYSDGDTGATTSSTSAETLFNGITFERASLKAGDVIKMVATGTKSATNGSATFQPRFTGDFFASSVIPASATMWRLEFEVSMYNTGSCTYTMYVLHNGVVDVDKAGGSENQQVVDAGGAGWFKSGVESSINTQSSDEKLELRAFVGNASDTLTLRALQVYSTCHNALKDIE